MKNFNRNHNKSLGEIIFHFGYMDVKVNVYKYKIMHIYMHIYMHIFIKINYIIFFQKYGK